MTPKPPSPPPESCARCAFASPVQLIGPDGQLQIGQTVLVCRRLPPTPVLVPAGGTALAMQSRFPVVDETMVCGEFREPPADDGG